MKSILTFMAVCTVTNNRKACIKHHIYCEPDGWSQKVPKDKPYVTLSLEFDFATASSLNMVTPDLMVQKMTTKGMADTGASVCMADLQVIRRLGLVESHLTPCEMELTSADKSSISILGAIPVIITDLASGYFTRQILYICNKASSLLLSLQACIDLKMVSS